MPTAEPIATAEPVTDADPVPVAQMVPRTATAPAVDPDPTTDQVPTVGVIPMAEATAKPGLAVAPEMSLSSEEAPATNGDPTGLDPAVAGTREEGKLTLREMALQSHREQMEIYDLDGDGNISEKEWKAATKEDLARSEKFFLVDEDEDGKIDENEAIGFLMDRISFSSTYLDATGDENADLIKDDIKEAAPSELRVTLFSIPLGD